MAILRPTWQDIITEHSVQTWQDWPWETWLGPYVVISPRRYRVRVRVWRAGEWEDITSRVASGVIRESNDQPVATLELRLLNGREYPSLAPRRKDSPLNRVQGQYVPLLWIGRLIAVEAAFSEDGSEPDEWWPVFVGELGDDIDTAVENGQVYVQVFCRDLAARLQRDYIAGPLTYENMFASQMIQQILNDRYAAGALPEPVTLRVVGRDDFFVRRYDIEYTDLWSALQRFCQQRGTDLRYRLNEATGQIELTYWLPDRAMVPGWIIDASQIRREELRISGTDIINRVTVRYRDAATGQRAEVTVQDADSIAMYGLRHGLIEEPDTDLIPDAATAQKLAQTIVEDLKDVPALTRITCPFDPRIQLFDKLRVANPSVRDEPEDYAIEGRELSFSATDWSMVLIGGGRVVVKRQAWLERLATAGVKQPFTPRDTTTAREPGAPTGLTGQFVGTDAVFSWDESLDPYHRRFAVEVRVGGQVKRRDYVEATSYTYTLDMNRHDNGTPSPQVELRVYSEYTTGALSAPAIVAVSHPAPPQPTLSLRSSSAQIRWAVTSPTPPAWEATTVQVGTYSETVAAMSGTVDAVEAGIADGNIATVTVKLRDVFGQEGQPATGQVTVNYLDKAAFAANIRPVELVSALPQLPNPQYPQGAVVFLTTDNKLYRSTGNSWTAAVPTTDLSGTITETQIANDAVTTPKLRAGAVTTDKLAAGAVTADKLAANSVTAGKIAAGAVTADAVGANQIITSSANIGDAVIKNAHVDELSADKIKGGTMRLTGDMAIINEDGTLQITSAGIEIESEEVGGTQWTPGGLVFNRPDGTRSGYVRAVVPGVAQDGDYVQLNFINEPVVILSPARAITYEPSVGGIQKLRLEAANASPEGFQVVAKLVRHDAQGDRIVFPRTQKYTWYSGSSTYCTDGGHTTQSDARAWSEHRLVTTGSSKIFTIGPGATGAIVRIREMLHAQAFQGVYHALNTITYRLRIREVGGTTWLQTLGPFTRSIDTKSSLFSSSFKWSHNLVSHAFGGLPPGEYEIQVEITNKTIRSGEGRNDQNSCTLIVEEIEEMSETEIPLPEPITVHYVAFESDNPGGEGDD